MSTAFQLPSLRPAVMGVLNVTPDSFSDGGSYFDARAAIDRAEEMVQEGADIIDVGGESTRPGAAPVARDEELRRVLPVISELARRGMNVSIDTTKASVAKEALGAGATIVNDVSGLRDPEMLEVAVRGEATLCVMHMQGTPQTMQVEPRYGDVVAEVRQHLQQAAAKAEAAGMDRGRIWIDPGIGFGKTDAHNFALLRRLEALVEVGYPVVIGISRKGFLGRLLGGASVDSRLHAALAVQTLAQSAGARILRTHDIRPTLDAIVAASVILAAAPGVEA